MPVPLTKGLSYKELGQEVKTEIGDDHTMAFAGNLTYHTILAIPAFLAVLLALVGLFASPSTVSEALGKFDSFLPKEALTLIQNQLKALTSQDAKSALSVGVVVSFLVAVWGVSGGMRSTMEAMNVVYDVKETRGFVKKYWTSIWLSLAVAALTLLSFTLVVAGPDIATYIASATHTGPIFKWTWTILQWPVLALLMLFSFALLYWKAPNTEPLFKFVTPGAVFAFVVWLIFSGLFSIYVNNFGSYNKTWGSLAGLIVFMLYVFYTSVIVLVGAQINQTVDRHAEGGKKRQLNREAATAHGENES